MPYSLFHRYAPIIRSLSPAEIDGDASLFDKLTIAREGRLQVCYAPFEYVNPRARLLIVGITPGRTQMLAAVREARRLSDAGATDKEVLRGAKRTGAFSGPMREGLIAMMDSVGIARWLGIPSAATLFGSATELVQTASALRNPVFVDGVNYNGTPDPARSPLLLDQLTSGFTRDLGKMPEARVLALGDKVAGILELVIRSGALDPNRVLGTIPHPSGANAERIKYFLGQKPRAALSVKVDPTKLDRAKASLIERIAALT